MKLEKLSDTQIRCTLSKEDLSQRQLHLSELAYGSEKAKELFRDMMQQASIELGFEADNIPLMIEAIPISNDCLVLVVTKVEDPDELDTRFSRFSKINMDDSFDEDFSDIDDTDFEEMDFLDDEDDIDMDDEPLPFSPSSDFDNADSDASTSSKERSAIDDALDLIAPFTQAIAQAKKEAMRKKKENRSSVQDCQYYSFQNFSQAAQLGAFLAPFFEGESSLYKDSFSNNYYMILRKTQSENNTFHRACNIAADFGVRISASYATPAYFREHFETILEENAVEMLGELA
ncbi:adaptor protein MecA [Anaerobutyricum hallii]|uniref:Adaptor protein MecA n=1 Tax=Anaerobutyricum hallii TaxID=39488 RepID=A0A414B907_9FIRM|nr:adaptor protein MecA [Anaerobutyricum hallii]RHC67563.1 adaptor protein MecA [Anaerobutyricum hallii]